MFPVFPFAFMPPFPFVAPFAAFFPFTGSGRDSGSEAPTTHPATSSAEQTAQAMMSLAMMPFAAPLALSTQIAQQMGQVIRDAGTVAREMQDALEHDDGPVHVMIGDPEGPGGLAIGITLYRRGETSTLRDVRDAAPPTLTAPDHPAPGPLVDVTPPKDG